jgi:hypothetical protein
VIIARCTEAVENVLNVDNEFHQSQSQSPARERKRARATPQQRRRRRPLMCSIRMLPLRPDNSRQLLVNLEKLGVHEKLDLLTPYIAIDGVLTRQKCAAKWCATLWGPGLQFSVSPHSQIFDCHDVW